MDKQKAHKYSFANKKMLEKENWCGCFYCCTIFSPYCGIDSVIGESVGYPLTKEALQDMGDVWFSPLKSKD